MACVGEAVPVKSSPCNKNDAGLCSVGKEAACRPALWGIQSKMVWILEDLLVLSEYLDMPMTGGERISDEGGVQRGSRLDAINVC